MGTLSPSNSSEPFQCNGFFTHPQIHEAANEAANEAAKTDVDVTTEKMVEVLTFRPLPEEKSAQIGARFGDKISEAAEKDLPGSILFGEPLAEDKSDAGAP